MKIKPDNFSDDEEFKKYKENRKKQLTQIVHEITDERFLIKKIFKDRVILHVYKNEFTTCKRVNTILDKLVGLYPQIQFYKIEAEKAPIISEKLEIKTLPYLGLFAGGYYIDSIVGLDKVGGMDFNLMEFKNYIDKSDILN
ncbi:Thioredoxin [Spraguea lophii 42_110]|uniref:Thioredoxin n=1 Tax=Spraguea lophii (strain 42_110) TaxID=1358809 RepID=S7XUU3_SPRLO|nr:Thioredoxin [Spraguea lophii 42_110]